MIQNNSYKVSSYVDGNIQTVDCTKKDAIKKLNESGLLLGKKVKSLSQKDTTTSKIIETAGKNYEVARNLYDEKEKSIKSGIGLKNAILNFFLERNIYLGSLRTYHNLTLKFQEIQSTARSEIMSNLKESGLYQELSRNQIDTLRTKFNQKSEKDPRLESISENIGYAVLFPNYEHPEYLECLGFGKDKEKLHYAMLGTVRYLGTELGKPSFEICYSTRNGYEADKKLKLNTYIEGIDNLKHFIAFQSTIDENNTINPEYKSMDEFVK